MTINGTVIAGAIIWAACVLGGLVHWLVLEGDTAGGWAALGALLIFLLWQAVALGIAVLVLVIRLVGREGIVGVARWLGFVPIALS
ncbi:MAG: hypothetical protein AAGB15_04655, partial [Pseudomonadota bacterium]